MSVPRAADYEFEEHKFKERMMFQWALQGWPLLHHDCCPCTLTGTEQRPHETFHSEGTLILNLQLACGKDLHALRSLTGMFCWGEPRKLMWSINSLPFWWGFCHSRQLVGQQSVLAHMSRNVSFLPYTSVSSSVQRSFNKTNGMDQIELASCSC